MKLAFVPIFDKSIKTLSFAAPAKLFLRPVFLARLAAYVTTNRSGNLAVTLVPLSRLCVLDLQDLCRVHNPTRSPAHNPKLTHVITAGTRTRDRRTIAAHFCPARTDGSN